jgi:ABC-type uncharacterized transport system permease subunit
MKDEGSRLGGLLQPIIALALGFLVAGIVVALTGGNPIAAFMELGRGAFGDDRALLRTLAKATPLIFSGLAVALGLRAGLFNIGAEGQFLVGGMAAAWAGFTFKGLSLYVHLPLAMAAGAMAGGLWAFIPGLLKAWRGTHEVIVTIMMNYIAIHLTHYLVTNPFRDPQGIGKTPEIAPTAQLWAPPPPYSITNFSAGFFLALLAAALVAFLLKRTALGFEIRAVGQGTAAARAAGIRVGRTMIIAMTLSGLLAGLAGSVEALGVHHRFTEQFSAGYGFDSIAVALLGGLNAGGVLLSALLFGALNSGAVAMEIITQTPRQIAGIVQGVVILAVGVRYLRRRS